MGNFLLFIDDWGDGSKLTDYNSWICEFGGCEPIDYEDWPSILVCIPLAVAATEDRLYATLAEFSLWHLSFKQPNFLFF